ncbi:protein-glutamate methylesterase/protein-glutamine glutaminase [Marinospirillum alkaliphilum]|uniref:Protein-glutamate methylesterase/protein-glutamine glutaminase n=1 Tax=Marinospirillum alkaliphilum DSM 21637 TaxID=1122209 RepID=A0A1K1UBP0_9GAMM|nr:chemotaxis response regulator protein-glutamate methylesterase [Marinospirillum alkaliphilum]SFX10457.1 two-component system, chemotaxis family, response regulator CheB [Marinospirillum alkaliphilum DSM 21637]
MKNQKIGVLVVDDSALIRKLLTEIIDAQPDMKVLAVAPDPLVARELIKLHNPDVLTLDVEMPRMDGLDFLERLMRLRPMPVLMVSSLTDKGSEVTLRALELGAVDYIAKPKVDIASGLQAYAELIAEKIRACAQARVGSTAGSHAADDARRRAQAVNASRQKAGYSSTEKIIFVGASTGGTEAIKDFLIDLPADMPAIMITQHMPENFTRTFAERLDKLCVLKVREAVHNERVLPGHVYIAPGNQHLEVTRSGANYMTRLHEGPPVNRHRPSVDVLFHSAAQVAGANAVGVILTGMGRDGAAGLLEMKRAGAYTLAQDEKSCIVFGMPKEAIALGAADEVLPLTDMPARVIERLGQRINRV